MTQDNTRNPNSTCFICGKQATIKTDIDISYCSWEHCFQHYQQIGITMDEIMKLQTMEPEQRKEWLLQKMDSNKK